MSRHEGVSCDSCLKGNFRGKRYKCLICYDYDLCATCYEASATTTRHTTEHPMQCILTRSDFDLYYGGEAISVEQPQSFTCPFCGKMGYTEATLQEHVTAEHSDTTFEVICPICAALPGGEPNHVTDDFAAHLTLEHRNPRDMDEPSSSRHVRRIPHPGRGMSSTRAARRSQMQFSSSSGLSSLSPSSRETMDPIAELLSQLSGVRRTGNLPQPSTTSQLHQLQMQLQLERQQAQAARQQLERLPRRQAQVTGGTSTPASSVSAATTVGNAQSQYTVLLEPLPSPATTTGSQFLLSRFTEPTLTEAEQQALEAERVDRSLFVQELILATLTEELSLCDDWDSISKKIALVDESSSSIQESTPTCKDDSSCCSPNSACVPPRSSPFLPQQNSGKVRKVPNSTSVRQGGRSGGNSSQASQANRGGGVSQRGSGNRQLSRGSSGASPSSTRRKVPRQVDDRNKSSEPPPPH